MLPGRTYTFDDIIGILKRRLFVIAIPVLLAGVATVAVLDRLPNRYRSSTLIMVVPQRVPESYVKSTVTARIEDRLQSLSQQLLSRTRLEGIIRELNLYKAQQAQAPMEDIVERMRADIQVQLVKGDAFRVSYISEIPIAAQKVTDRLTSLFIEESLKNREVLAEATNEFLDTQLEDARRRLVAQEKQLEQYRMEHAGQLPSQLQSNLQAAGNLQSQVQTLVDSMNRDRDRRLLLERTVMELQATPDTPPPAPVAVATERDVLIKRLDTLRAALAALETRMTTQHPDVVSARQAIKDLEAEISATPAPQVAAATPATPASDAAGKRRIESLNSEIKALDAQIAEKEQRRKAFADEISAYDTRIAALPARESEISALTRDYDTMQKLYADLLSKREQSKVAANLERRQIGEQFMVLDQARLPEKPFSPNRPLFLLVGLAAGFGLGALIAGWLEFRDTTLRSEADIVATLQLPLLVLVPDIHTKSERRWRRFRVTVWSVGATTLFVVAVFLAWKYGAIEI